MSTKFTTYVMVLGVVFSEGELMLPYFFDQGLKVTADVYLKVLQDVVVPWMQKVAAHNAWKTQERLAENVLIRYQSFGFVRVGRLRAGYQ